MLIIFFLAGKHRGFTLNFEYISLQSLFSFYSISLQSSGPLGPCLVSIGIRNECSEGKIDFQHLYKNLQKDLKNNFWLI